MPEGFSSVADLRVVVDANADKFHSGVSGVMHALGDLDKNGNQSLSGLDKVLAAVGDASIGVSGKFKALTAGVEAGVALYQQFAKEGRAVAETLGVTTEYDKLKASVDDLGMSLIDGAVGAFFAVKSAGMDAASSMFGFADATSVGDENAKSFAATLLDSVTGAIDSVRLRLRLLNSGFAENAAELNTTVQLIDKQIEGVRERMRAMQADQAPRTEQRGFGRAGATVDLMLEAERELNRLLEQRNDLEAKRRALPGQDWVDGTQTIVSLLGQEVASLEQRNATLGMGAAAAAEYNAFQKAMADAQRQGIVLSAEAIESYRQEAVRIGELTAYAEAFRKGEQDREREKQAAEQRTRAGQQVYANAEREIGNLRSRAAAVGLNAGAAAELVMQERLLQQLRASGNEADGAELVRIRALAVEYGRLTEEMAAQQQELREMGEVGDAVAGGLSSAFANWTRTTEFDVKSMVASILADLAQLTLRRNVLEPLFGGGGMGGSGGSGLFGSALSSIFGGFRAGGGDVEAGRAYVVGEQRPELFIPRQGGTILPSVGGGRAGGDINVYIHGTPELDARVESTAEGVVVRRASQIVGQSVKAVAQSRKSLGLDAY